MFSHRYIRIYLMLSVFVFLLITTFGANAAEAIDSDHDSLTDFIEDLSSSEPAEELFADSFESDAQEAVLVLNEIDYDQVGLDIAEYVEIYNAGPGPALLTGLQLILLNGSSGVGIVYGTYSLPAISLGEGDYFVICLDVTTVANCDLEDSTLTIQNGSSDAVAIMDGDNILDSVSYEGDPLPPWTEGPEAAPGDINNLVKHSISRIPNGTDTDNNGTDWILTCGTPGAENVLCL